MKPGGNEGSPKGERRLEDRAHYLIRGEEEKAEGLALVIKALQSWAWATFGEPEGEGPRLLKVVTSSTSMRPDERWRRFSVIVPKEDKESYSLPLRFFRKDLPGGIRFVDFRVGEDKAIGLEVTPKGKRKQLDGSLAREVLLDLFDFLRCADRIVVNLHKPVGRREWQSVLTGVTFLDAVLEQ